MRVTREFFFTYKTIRFSIPIPIFSPSRPAPPTFASLHSHSLLRLLKEIIVTTETEQMIQTPTLCSLAIKLKHICNATYPTLVYCPPVSGTAIPPAVMAPETTIGTKH